MVWIELMLASALSIIHFYSEKYSYKVERFHDELVSFSAGLFITQIFVFLLPEFVNGKEFIGEIAFTLLLAGFVAFHIAEKYIYQHVKNKHEMMKDLGEVHAAGFFVDHFVVGMAIVFAFSSQNIVFGFMVFIALLLHTISSSVSLTHIDAYFNQSTLVNVLLSIAPVAGVIFAGLLSPGKELYYAIFSIVIGGLLYVGIRDMLPSKEEGRIGYFFFGFAVSLAITVLISGSAL